MIAVSILFWYDNVGNLIGGVSVLKFGLMFGFFVVVEDFVDFCVQ